jgi:hypothetical protein
MKSCFHRLSAARRHAAQLAVASSAAALLLGLGCQRSSADAFTAGDVVVSQLNYVGADPTNSVVQGIVNGDLTAGSSGNTFADLFNNPNIPGVQGTISLNEYGTSNVESNAAVAALQNTTNLPAPSAADTGAGLTGSFSSKSEGALMTSVNGQYLTMMGYQAPAGAIGVSNSYTPGAVPSPFPSGATSNVLYNRVVEEIGSNGSYSDGAVLNDAYSGDNARAAISVNGQQFYTVGNSDGGYTNTVQTLGARYSTLGASTSTLLGYQQPAVTGSTNNLPTKYDNYRSEQIFDNTLYVAKGSGGKGIDGIFQVGNTGTLPTTAGNAITPLAGLTFTAKTSAYHPFGFFFANANTLYVADEGAPTAPTTNGPGTITNSTEAGLQKWSFNASTKQWMLDYVMTNGLDMNVLKPVSGYTYTDASGKTETVYSAITGLRNMTGVVNADGTVTIYAITGNTSIISGGEPDPTSLVSITDPLAGMSLSTNSSYDTFSTLATSPVGDVFRGVALAPSVPISSVPDPAALALLTLGAVGAMCLRRRAAR